MNHLCIIIASIISLEILLRFNILLKFNSIIILINKSVNTILSKIIGDNWKEKVIPIYSLKIMKFSLQIIFVLLLIAVIFYVLNIINIGFLSYLFSIIGLIESILIAFGYLYLRQVIINE